MLNNINPTTHMDNFNVLLVDDVNINLVLGERLLAKLGVSVCTANSGVQCLQKMTQHEYQLILLDIHMEPMSGIETMSKIRQQPRWNKVLIVAISSSFAAEIITQCKGFSVSHFFKRPFLKSDLSIILTSLTSHELPIPLIQ